MIVDWNSGPYIALGRFSIWWTWVGGIFYQPSFHCTLCCYFYLDVLGLEVQLTRS